VKLLHQDEPESPNRTVRILHLEDNRLDQELVEALLKESGIDCEITTVQTRIEFVQGIQKDTCDLILADYSLPSFDGFAALTIAHQLCPDTPFIFVSGVMGEDIAVETLKRGATDYVLKRKMERLDPAVRRALGESVERRRRRRAEAELTQSEEQLRLLVDAVQDYALYMVNMAGIVVSWNSGAARILGYSEQEIVGLSFSRFFCGDDRQEARIERLLNVAERTGRTEEEVWNIRKDGTRFWASLVLRPLASEKGKTQGFAILTRDISEQQTATKELEESRQERARLQDRFLSHISHELRTPLTTIVDFTSILLEGLAGAITQEQKQYLDLISRASNQLGAMVNGLLDLTRSEWKRLPVDLACVGLEEIVLNTCKSLSLKAKTKHIQLESWIPAKLPLVYADPARVVEILTNLCDNAIKYIPAGKKINVECVTFDNDPDFVQVCVRDDGPGIAPEQRRRIFERFYRAAEASADHPGGLGLGLYITRELVKAHGGDLALTGKIGQGSAFTFTLPTFSLARILLPLMSPRNLATGSVALITLKIPEKPNCPALDFGRYMKDLRVAVKSCTYETSDLVLPAMHVKGLECMVHVVAFTDDEGVRAIIKRIQDHLLTCVEWQPLEGGFELNGRVLALSTEHMKQADDAARSIADELSTWIGLTTDTGGNHESRQEQSAGN
jgi:PAS domain S-box-containing protein